ncbi:hypothetical protein [Arenicella xantha]|uniref:Tetratricopeptide repeat protein n=1 Tax=Arenicella xantha TaxID=644221 RepID=A0A395JPK2_9GAMM|nr:hypothetical protein [Arenicella xantha]RBP51727.1 hypothetical protein DFR28_1021160 [Arenicella xantha]
MNINLKKYLFVAYIALLTLVSFEIALASPSPLSPYRSQLDLVFAAIDEGDNEKVFNTILDIKSDDNIAGYVKGMFLIEVGQRYDQIEEYDLGINAYKEILSLKDSLGNGQIYSMALRLIAGNYLVLDKPKLACEYGRKLTFEQKSKPVWKSVIFLAYCEYLQENYQEALAEAENAKAVSLQVNTKDVEDAERQVFSIQAAVYEKLGRNRDAVIALSNMYDSKPTPELMARINRLRKKYDNSSISD